MQPMRTVMDTNVFAAALRSGGCAGVSPRGFLTNVHA
jgi:hypothetical protein